MSTPRPRPQVMKLSDRAAERIKAITAEKGAGAAGLRIGVKKGGCAGMEYTLDWAAEQKPFDEVVEHNGARVLIDPKAVMYLLGHRDGLQDRQALGPVRVHQPQPDGLLRLRRVGQPGARRRRQARGAAGLIGALLAPLHLRHPGAERERSERAGPGRDLVHFVMRYLKVLPTCRGMIAEQEFADAVHGSRAFGPRRAAP